MHLGFSTMDTPMDPPIAELARTLEELGYESLWTGEHSHIPMCRTTPYMDGAELPEPYKHMQDPYVSLTVAAAATTKLKIGTGIALPLERDLFSQAKTIATLDRFSGGRFIMGVGVGWNEEEFTNVSTQPWKKRYSVLREAVAALRSLWTDPSPEYHGQFIDFDPVWCEPKPQQKGGPKVLFGAGAQVGLKNAAQWADGWLPVDVTLGNTLEEITASINKFRELLKEYDRDPDQYDITLQTMITPDLDRLKAYQDLGINRIIIGVDAEGWDKPERIMPLIERFAKYIPEVA
ncbi:LLM class F420-dependent oxidoreductase [Parahaliea sp. F7430]|uniref:LLM class F420-dependent oxidoreductase n=1 Tax=Sediminihaliea albiluteola TaxID=2758564 RepID=A0A7W2YJN6_9GAMM|nr:LLM class F420-dependent oxidoreductase [Sediminihaliea albiluteola]MBA6413781.1 LLM class F420-dependent oxidoreductase [Sediminihaliea albiluteola]